MIGQTISNYEIKSILGEGGMGMVYLAENIVLGNKVALKILKDEFVRHPNIRKRFLAEARNLAKMHHSSVIKVTDLIDAGDVVAFVMEYIDGISLDDYIIENSPLSNNTIESLLKQMIVALEYVHDQGLVHRDIKPSNFMVTNQGSIKLLDFGIAKNLNDGPLDYTRTNRDQQIGTPMYMSPEQVQGTLEITKQTDIYSLGVVLWQMVMNKRPYDSGILTLPEIQVAIMKEPLALTNSKWDGYISRMVQKESKDRSLDFSEINHSKNHLKKMEDRVLSRGSLRYSKKIFIWLGSFLLIALSCIAFWYFSPLENPNKLENDWDKSSLKGKVKTLTSINDPRFHKKLRFKELSEVYTSDDYFDYSECLNARVEYDTTKFDIHGYRTYRSSYSINPFGFETGSNEFPFLKFKNYYNKANQLILIKENFFGNKFKKVRELFYENGFLIRDDQLKQGMGNQKLFYDEKGNLKTIVTLDRKNEEYHRREYFYNAKGQCVRMSYGKDGSGSELYFYDSSNKMIRRVQKYENKVIEEGFNSFGDLSYIKSFDYKKTYKDFDVYEYSYDKNNNWIKQTRKSSFGFSLNRSYSEIDYIIKRKIVYY